MFLSISFSLPSPLSENKKIFKNSFKKRGRPLQHEGKVFQITRHFGVTLTAGFPAPYSNSISSVLSSPFLSYHSGLPTSPWMHFVLLLALCSCPSCCSLVQNSVPYVFIYSSQFQSHSLLVICRVACSLRLEALGFQSGGRLLDDLL